MSTLTPDLNVMVGPAGSGKSTVAEIIRRSWRHKRFVVICPDELREKFCNGDRSDQSQNGRVWKEAYRLLEEAMIDRKDIIFDSTMVNRKKRKDILKIGKKHGYHILAHVVDKPLERILEQNANRRWKVPEHIVRNMYDSYEEPTKEEGFDNVFFYKEDVI